MLCNASSSASFRGSIPTFLMTALTSETLNSPLFSRSNFWKRGASWMFFARRLCAIFLRTASMSTKLDKLFLCLTPDRDCEGLIVAAVTEDISDWIAPINLETLTMFLSSSHSKEFAIESISWREIMRPAWRSEEENWNLVKRLEFGGKIWEGWTFLWSKIVEILFCISFKLSGCIGLVFVLAFVGLECVFRYCSSSLKKWK